MKGWMGPDYTKPLEPIEWFTKRQMPGIHVWAPPPAAAARVTRARLDLASESCVGSVLTVTTIMSAAFTAAVAGSALGATSGNVVFTIGSAASNSGVITNPGGFFSGDPSAAALTSVADLDVLTVLNSQRMMTAIDGALVRIDLERSDLGATMSRMEYTINNLSNISVNTQAARSRINDSDIAKETSELTKAQVLNQAAQAMLSQANRSSQAILGLLSDL